MSKKPSKKRSQRNDPRRERTRRALMNAALELMQEVHSFNAISLREVAREAGVVPSAFYRHFDDMSALGAAIAAEALEIMRAELRQTREETADANLWREQSAQTLSQFLDNHPTSTHFLLRERYGSNEVIRHIIHQGLALQESELSTDLLSLPQINQLKGPFLADLSSLIINLAIAFAETYLNETQDIEKQKLTQRFTNQLTVVFRGVQHWQQSGGKP